jgi:hypothetical protein
MKKLLLFTLILSLPIAAHAQEAFSTLEERMSGKEFKETGLSKLTDEELATLNEWVRSHSVATLENATARPAAAGSAAYASATEDTRGFEYHKKTNDPNDKTINSNIVGTFTGWTGDSTVFTLANGMVWKQAESAAFRIKPTENAEITIKKGMFGGWRLSMVGRNKSVSVNRIQ